MPHRPHDGPSEGSSGTLQNELPTRLPRIKLRHGQVMWLLTELGYGGEVSRSTFHEYLKSLRKLGIPFGGEKFQTKHGRRPAEYSYCHVMELAITLSLRIYHVVPDSVLNEIVRYRRRLHRLYRKAYSQRCGGAGRPISIEGSTHGPIELRGVFLDLDIKFSGGHLVHFGSPKLLSPTEALAVFGQSILPIRTLLLMNLSLLSEQVTAFALRAPTIRSGPPRASQASTQPRQDQ